MHIRTRILTTAIVAGLAISITPSTAFAQSPEGSLTECIEAANGDKEAFLDCVASVRASLQEQFDLPDGWFEQLTQFVEENPDWAQWVRRVADRLEDRWDRREDRRDDREDRRDRFEDWRDRTEDLRDRWEDLQDEELDREDLFDRLEDRRDQREDRWDRRENRYDRRENYRDRFEDWRDRPQPQDV